MSYEKKFGVGNVYVDMPYAQFIHELPLLSFGDVRHNINVSLIFQSGESSNLFSISNGFKFNLQKRLIMSGNIPVKFEDASGKLIKLNTYGDRFVFDDGSKRIIRKKQDGTLVLENPDYSQEVYDVGGRITTVRDKYGNDYLTYVYSQPDYKLESVKYRNKTIKFKYNTSSGRVEFLEYVYGTKSVCETKFEYTGANISVKHYCGVTYDISYLNGNFVVYATSNSSEEYSPHRLECTRSSASLIVKETIGATVVDTTTYDFVCNSGENKFDVWDVTNYSGVKTRIQFKDGKPAYSYEIREDMFREALLHPHHDFVYPSNYFGTITCYDNGQAVGTQEYDDGIKMCFEPYQNKWLYYIPTSEVEPQKTGLKYLVVSGWIKKLVDSSTNKIEITLRDIADVSEIPFCIDDAPYDQWMYISYIVPASEIDTPWVEFNQYWNSSRLSTKDFRITPYYENNLHNNSHVPTMETVLIGKDANCKEVTIPIVSTSSENSQEAKTTFYNGSTEIDQDDYLITENDIIRYKINQMYGTHKNEIYFNNCRGVIPNAGEFKVKYSDANGSTSVVNVKDATIEKNYSVNGNTYSTQITCNTDENAEHGLVVKKLENEYCYNETKYDVNHLDLLVSQNEDAVTSYDRNNCGLILSQTVAKVSGEELYKTDISYDNDCTKVESTTDEFDQKTKYTTDDVWGVVTEVHLNDGTIIKDYYDEDMSTLRHKSFSKGNKEKTYGFGYSDAGCFEVWDDTFYYAYDRLWWKNGEQYIKKFENLIEMHKMSVTSGEFEDIYPDQWEQIYKQKGTFDKYGRVTKIDELLENTYGVSPIYVPGEGGNQGQYNFLNINNSNSQLAESRDLTTQKVTKYAYEKGRASRIGEFDNNTLVNEEIFTYDDIGRLVKDEYIYDKNGGKSVSSEIQYNRSADDPCADNRAYVYSYKVNNQKKVDTFIFYDSFKRVTQKDLTFYDPMFWAQKFFTYDKTRVSKVTDKYRAGQVMGINEYTYDTRGRITKNTYVSDTTASQETTYQYDEFGQLIREDNEALDKTYVYEYNDIGNITCVKEYDYTKAQVLPSCYKSVVYAYDTECPDRLTKFDGYKIEYNSIGYPSKYKNINYKWENGKLAKVHRGLFDDQNGAYDECTFTYDGYGRRTRKYETHGVNHPAEYAEHNYSFENITEYSYDNNGRLIRESRTYRATFSEVTEVQREFVYLYDESGIIGVMYSYNGSTPQPYYYHRNLQGDVIAIYDANGEKQVEYAYDAWGNCKTVYGENDELAYLNPIRYRGYYYDTETKLYYLNARYYSPEWRRFISPDAAEYIDPETPNGLNLYAYCNNDPVNYADPSGHFVITTAMLLTALGIGAAIGAGVGFAAAYIPDVIENATQDGFQWSDLNTFEENWRHYLGATLGGAIAGAGVGFCSILGAGIGVAMSMGSALTIAGTTISGGTALMLGVGGAFITGAAGYTVRTGISNQETFDLSDMFVDATSNAISGLLTFGSTLIGGTIGIKVPGSQFVFKNFVLYHFLSACWGVYPIKGVLAYMKSILKEKY